MRARTIASAPSTALLIALIFVFDPSSALAAPTHPPAAAASATIAVRAAASGTSSAPSLVEGTVLVLDGGDVIIDLGSRRGLSDGDVVALWRPVHVKHPVTGKIVHDRFRIGALKVAQARDALSLARPDGALLRAVAVGDVVTFEEKVLVSAPPAATIITASTATTAPAATSDSGVSVAAESGEATTQVDDDDARELSELFDSLRGMAPDARAARYEGFAAAHPASRFVAALLEEAALLRSRDAAPRAADRRAMVLSFTPPKELYEGHAVSFALEIAGAVHGAVLHVRSDDEATFVSLPMRALGDRYWSATIPAERIRGAAVRYFIETVDPTGVARPIVGDAGAPSSATVVSAPEAPRGDKTERTVALWSDYADYNRLIGNDIAWQTEGYFGLRLRDTELRAVRSGFGVFKGRGGDVLTLDDDKTAAKGRAVGLSYGYLEAEWGFTSFWALVARGIVGLGEHGVTGGAQAFVRIGNDKSTNLLIGGEILGGVGLRGITQIELNMFPRWPILIRSEVTNQPAGVGAGSSTTPAVDPLTREATGDSNIGVRAIGQVGYRVTPQLTVSIRGSYQGRNIVHAGPGVGVGLQWTW